MEELALRIEKAQLEACLTKVAAELRLSVHRGEDPSWWWWQQESLSQQLLATELRLKDVHFERVCREMLLASEKVAPSEPVTTPLCCADHHPMGCFGRELGSPCTREPSTSASSLKSEPESPPIAPRRLLPELESAAMDGHGLETEELTRTKKVLARLRFHHAVCCVMKGNLAKRLKAASQQLAVANHTLQSLGSELAERFTCPIGYTFLSDPVMGSDCVTYERQQIERYLKETSRSPWTRAPMRSAMLRTNRLAQDLMSIAQKYIPNLEASVPSRPHDVESQRDALMIAMSRKRADEAVELLGGNVSDQTLNNYWKHNGLDMTLMELAMSWNLPTVAVAIAERVDFRRLAVRSDTGLFSIHLAAFHNYPEVAQAIMKDLSASVLQLKTSKAATLMTHDGQRVELQRGLTPLDILRQMGHSTSWAEEAAIA